ncbi:hypothetical protein ABL78_2738 [Leptomonas seymouri]|uniref:Uncharacterized protein n=1 Tax=Leptomonas seymouri TaxID=5684 RepID=A0A0N1I0G6_LEPSE|nr:hypothetical protein ABL78_2738 [Leptomonas seymouri]|eukprot:KPI88161.1 hypothetical protein ABL78_2738 [Leptomonas seymouri]
MGSGLSVSKSPTASPPQACPVFYNFTPNAQHIPLSTLPVRDLRGNVRRPRGGCAARIIALRNLPVVPFDTKRQAKEFLASVGKLKRSNHDDETALAKIAAVEEQAKSIQKEPCLTPTISSCFLINIAVDERGRLAPLSTDGAVGLTDSMSVIENGESESTAECGTSATVTKISLIGRKGFNFDTVSASNAAAGNRSKRALGSAGDSAERHLQLNSDSTSPEGTDTDSARGSSGAMSSNSCCSLLPSCEASALRRRDRGGARAEATGLASLPPSPEARPMTIFRAPQAHTASDNDGEAEDSDSSFTSSYGPSLLIRGGRFCRMGGGELPVLNAAAAATSNCGDSSTKRLRRQNLSIRLLNMPNRTRWFLFNDSSTHEAHMTVMLCYRKKTEAGDPPAMDAHRGGAASAPEFFPSKITGDHILVPGELKVMCVPTSLSHIPIKLKELQKEMETRHSSSRCFVEVKPLSLPDFVAALSTSSAESHRELLAKLEENASSMAVASLFIVLAPGETVFIAEGEATGYSIATKMIPFKSVSSMAVLSRRLTPDLVLELKQKSEALKKRCYHHKLIFLSNLKEKRLADSATEAPIDSSVSIAAAATAPAAAGSSFAHVQQFNADFYRYKMKSNSYISSPHHAVKMVASFLHRKATGPYLPPSGDGAKLISDSGGVAGQTRISRRSSLVTPMHKHP